MVNVPDFDTLYRADPDPWQVASASTSNVNELCCWRP